MIYTVAWKRRAKQELAELWMQASDRSAVTRAADRIEVQLRSEPLEAGESRDDDYRVLCILPLIVGYRVSKEDRLVTVVRVRANRA